MANSNFIVHNGITVGPLTVDAATGILNTTGNIVSSSTSDSTSTTTGSLVLSGGLAVGKNMTIEGNVIPSLIGVVYQDVNLGNRW